MSTDPTHVKTMRKTGSLIELPFKVLFGTAKMVKNKLSGTEKVEPPVDFIDKVEEDLLNAVNSMHYRIVNPEISVSATLKDPVARQMLEAVEQIRAGKDLKDIQNPRVESADGKGGITFFVAAHPVVFQEQEKLRDRNWKSTVQSILSRRDVIIELSDVIEQEKHIPMVHKAIALSDVLICVFDHRHNDVLEFLHFPGIRSAGCGVRPYYP